MGIAGEQLRGHLEALVLASLERGPAHGWEIWSRLEASAGGALKLKEGSLYPALYRLEEESLVKAEWETGETGRRGARRRIYKLTPAGRRRLVAARAEWQEFTTVMSGLLGVAT